MGIFDSGKKTSLAQAVSENKPFSLANEISNPSSETPASKDNVFSSIFSQPKNDASGKTGSNPFGSIFGTDDSGSTDVASAVDSLPKVAPIAIPTREQVKANPESARSQLTGLGEMVSALGPKIKAQQASLDTTDEVAIKNFNDQVDHYNNIYKAYTDLNGLVASPLTRDEIAISDAKIQKAAKKDTGALNIIKNTVLGLPKAAWDFIGVGKIQDYLKTPAGQEDALNLSGGDLAKAVIPTVGKFFGTPIADVAGVFTGPKTYNVPLVGKINNVQKDVQDAVMAGQNPYIAIVNTVPQAIFDGLMVAGIGEKLFSPREQVVATGYKVNDAVREVKTTQDANGNFKTVVPASESKSFKLTKQPKVTSQPIPNEAVEALIKQNGLNVKYDPTKPSFFKETEMANGKMKGQVVQLKPSLFDVFRSKFGGNIYDVPPAGLTVIHEQERTPQQIRDNLMGNPQEGDIMDIAKNISVPKVQTGGDFNAGDISKIAARFPKATSTEVRTQDTALATEAKKYNNPEDFISKMRGSATQYTDYTPELRKYGISKDDFRITEKGVDPELEVTIYRGVPNTKTKIVDGDFVTTDRMSAESYAGRNNVISKVVKAKDLIHDDPGNFDPKNPFFTGAEFIYSDSSNKLTKFTDKQLTDIYNESHGLDTNGKPIENINDGKTKLRTGEGSLREGGEGAQTTREPGSKGVVQSLYSDSVETSRRISEHFGEDGKSAELVARSAEELRAGKRVKISEDTPVALSAMGFPEATVSKLEKSWTDGGVKNIEFSATLKTGGDIIAAFDKTTGTLVLNPNEISNSLYQNGSIIDHEIGGHAWYSKLDASSQESFYKELKNNKEAIVQAWNSSDSSHLGYWERTLTQIRYAVENNSSDEIAEKIMKDMFLVFNPKITVPQFVDLSLFLDKAIVSINVELDRLGRAPISLKAYETVAIDEHVAMLAEKSGEVLADTEPLQNYLSDVQNGTLKYGPSATNALVYTGDVDSMLAPNGQKSNLNPAQYQVVRTPEFKNWFGDWENNPKNSSKIVDENGEPLVVYHGSSSANIDEFNPKYIGNRDSSWFGKGFYFALSKGEASYYGKNITDAFLDIKNPFDFSKYNFPGYRGYSIGDTYTISKMSDVVKGLENAVTGYIYGKGNESTSYSKIGTQITLGAYKKMVEQEDLTPKPVEVNDRGKMTISYKYNDIYGNEQYYDTRSDKPIPNELLKYVLFDEKYGTNFNIGGLYGVERMVAGSYGDQFTEELKNLGYDGTIQTPDGDEYVAFKPNQIKSASRNTTFGNTNNIGFREKTKDLDQLRRMLDREQQSLNAAVSDPVGHAMAYGENKAPIYEARIKDLKARIAEAKNPTFNTGNTLEDVRATLFAAEKRVGARSVPTQTEDIVPQVTPQKRKIVVPSEDTPIDLIHKKIDIDLRQEELKNSPFNQLLRYVPTTGTYAGQLPEFTGNKSSRNRFVREGDQLIQEIFGAGDTYATAPETEQVRAEMDTFLQRKRDLINDKIEYQKELKDFREKRRLEIASEKDAEALQKISERNSRLLDVKIGNEETRTERAAEKLRFIQAVEKALRTEGMDRARKIKDITDFFNLTADERKSVIRGFPDFKTMPEQKFQDLLKQIESKAYDMAAYRQAVMDIEATIEELELKKTENLREAMKMREIKNMSISELQKFNDLLQTFEKGDIFLGKRQIQTAGLTSLGDIKTHREARAALAREAGVSVENMGAIEPTWMDLFLGDIPLSQKNPLYKVMVEDVSAATVESGIRFQQIKEEFSKLLREARASRKRSIGERLVPTDDLIFDFLGATDAHRQDLMKDMTPQEIRAALYMKTKYAEVRDYLVQQNVLKNNGIRNYVTHTRRGVLEILKDQGKNIFSREGFKEFFKELWDAQKQEEANFKIMEDKTGEVLPLEKFFKYSISRTGQLIPSKNLGKVFLEYMRAFEQKRQLDSFIPKLDIFAHVFTPAEKTQRGLIKNDTLVTFVKKWLNTKKGRIMYTPFEKTPVDTIIRFGIAFTRLKDLALNIPTGLASNVGAQLSSFIPLGPVKYSIGVARSVTPQGRRIVREYEFLIGETLKKQLTDVSKNLGEKAGALFYTLFSSANRRALSVFLLGEMTPEEFRAGEVSQARLAQLRLEMGRYHVIEGTTSVTGKTAAGAAVRQYKSWAIPIASTTVKNLQVLAKMAKEGDFKNAGKSREFKELFRTTFLTLMILLLGYNWYNNIKNKKDRSFLDQLAYKAMNDALSLIGALDPSMWLTTRAGKFYEDLAVNVSTIIASLSTGDRAANGDVKGVDNLISTIKPSVLGKAKESDSEKIKHAIYKSAADAQSNLDSLDPDLAKTGKATWEQVKKLGAGTEEADNLVGDLSEDELKATKYAKAADVEYWVGLSNKITPLVENVSKVGFGTEEADAITNEFTPDEMKVAKQIKKAVYQTNEEGEPNEWDKQSFLTHVSNVFSGWVHDPVTAFDDAIHGDYKIIELRNGQILVERMPEDASQAMKKQVAKDNSKFKLDHIVPLKSGGTNRLSNLEIVPTEIHAETTKIENFLSKALKDKKITGAQAREYIIRYKASQQDRELTPEIRKEYDEKYGGKPMTYEDIQAAIK